MKRYLFYILLGWWAFSSCFDDKGNYDYREINELSIAGIGRDTTYTLMAFADVLRLQPEIASTLEKDESEYEYEWKLIPSGIDINEVKDGEDFVIGRDKNLEWLAEANAGTYAGFYIVTDKSTGVAYRERFSVRLTTMMSEGWLVLCDMGGEARLDMVVNRDETMDIIAKNIWANQDFSVGKPLKLLPCWFRNKHSRMLLVSEKGTYEIDKSDMHVGEDTDFKWFFGIVPEVVNLQMAKFSQRCTQGEDRWTLVTESGDVYSELAANGVGFFGYPVNFIKGERFEAAPFVGVMNRWIYIAGASDPVPVMLYDATNRQFVNIKQKETYPSVMEFSGDKKFDARTGRDFVAGASTYSSLGEGLNWVVLKDPNTSRHYAYGILMGYDEKNEQRFYEEIKGPGLENATQFAFSNNYNHIYYLSNNTIYAFDVAYPDEEAIPVLTFPGEKIKVIKFEPLVSNNSWGATDSWQRKRAWRLIVGSVVDGMDESECGIMRTYDTPQDLRKGKFELHKEHDKLGNIVDITYKEPDKN